MEKSEKINFFIFNLGMGLFITILLTTPSIFFLSNHLIGYPHDGFEYIYKFWWFKKAIFDFGASPSHTLLLNYPVVDQNLTINTSPVLPILSLIFSFLNLNLLGYNIMLLSSFILSMGLTASICYEICRNKLAASLAGLIFAFNCNTIAHAIGGHLAQITVFPILLFIISYLQFISKRSLFTATITGIFGGICLLIDLKVAAYTFLPIFIFLTIFKLRKLITRWKRADIFQFIFMNLIIVIIVFPFYKPLLFSGLNGDTDYLYQPGTIKHSASLLSFVIPPPESFLIKLIPSLSKLSETIAMPGWHENVFFIGWFILVFAIFGAILILKDKLFFGVEIVLLTIFSLVMALGPYLKIVVDPISFTIQSNDYWFSMPYFYISKIPFMDLGRTPSRYMTIVWLGLSILAAFGISKFTQLITINWVKRLVIPILVLVILIEINFTFPFPVSPVNVPRFYNDLVLNQDEFAILDLPLWDYRCTRKQMYFATIHQHPIVGGIITRRSVDAENSMKSVENLLEVPNQVKTRIELEKLTIKYVIAHKNCSIDPLSPRENENLTQRLGKPIYSDEEIDVFEVY